MRRFDWFLFLLAASVIIRLFLAIFTQGTYDIKIWEDHARAISQVGLTDYYKATLGLPQTFNHPPFAGKLVTSLFTFSQWSDIPFRIVFRLLFTSLDYVTAYYIYRIFSNNPRKLTYVAFYLLNPITIIFSAYHGNTDTSLGLFILLSIYLISRNNIVLAGIVFGLGAWIKWIVLLAFPPLFFAIPGLKDKTRYTASLTVAALAGYAWHLINEPAAVINSVFGYTGQLIQTTGRVPVWGNRIIVKWLADMLNSGSGVLLQRYIITYNSLALAGLILLYSWLRRNRQDSLGMGKTVGEIFIIFHGTTNFWAFQYLGWSTPFWIFLSWPLLLSITLTCSGYIYLLYSLVCGSLLLMGTWDFAAHPQLSPAVLFFRNCAILLFMTLTIYLFVSALRRKRTA